MFSTLQVVVPIVHDTPPFLIAAGAKDLSDQAHYKGGVHNAEYDHEAFLGKAEAQRFHDLPPEEARRRLG